MLRENGRMVWLIFSIWTLLSGDVMSRHCELPVLEISLRDMFAGYVNVAVTLSFGGSPDPAVRQITYDSLSELVGLNISTRTGLHEFTCKLAAVESIEELAATVGSPVGIVESTYLEYQRRIQEVNGMSGMWEVDAAFNEITHWIEMTDYPNTPLMVKNIPVSRDNVRDFFTYFQEKYAEYLSALKGNSGEGIGVPFDAEPAYLARVLTTPMTRERLAEALSYPNTSIFDKVDVNKPLFCDMRAFNKAAFLVLQELDLMGWQNLGQAT